jgi:hypothetical protein
VVRLRLWVRWLVNQSRASMAAVVRVPGSSNRWVAPGQMAARRTENRCGVG